MKRIGMASLLFVLTFTLPNYGDINADLLEAAKAGQTETVRALLTDGADVDSKFEDGRTALTWAVEGGHTETVKLLLDAGADVNTSYRNVVWLLGPIEDWTALATAAMKAEFNFSIKTYSEGTGEELDWIGIAELLLEAGADLNTTSGGKTALEYAVTKGYAEFVQLLIDAGADVKSAYGGIVLREATRLHHTEIVRIFLDAGADVNATGRGGHTALWYAARQGYPGNGQIEFVLLLLERGANVNVGIPPLIPAAAGDDTEIVRILLDRGADVNSKESWAGMTPLISAAQDGTVEIVRMLLDAGADINAVDDSGLTALLRAKGGDYLEKVRLLKSAGAKE